MRNVLEIDGCKAVIAFDPELGLFRGDFVGLSGGADFYAASVQELMEEGRTSLRVYLGVCEERGVDPFAAPAGGLAVQLDPKAHEVALLAAAAADKSLDEWVSEKVVEAAMAG